MQEIDGTKGSLLNFCTADFGGAKCKSNSENIKKEGKRFDSGNRITGIYDVI